MSRVVASPATRDSSKTRPTGTRTSGQRFAARPRGWLPLAVLAGSVVAVLLWSLGGVGASAWFGVPASHITLNGAALEPAVDLPDLTFARSDGKSLSTADTRGRLSLFFFGYTHCADVCPLSLAQFSQMRRTLGADASQVDMYFVTLDPVRDTPERMQTYVANFPGVIGLVGSNAELARALSTFNVVAERQDVESGDYLIDHTAATYLVNPDSQIQLVYPYGTAPQEIAADLHRLAQTTPASLTVRDTWARAADVGETSAVYLRIQNPSAQPDRLLSVSSTIGTAAVHYSMTDGNVMRMRAVDAVEAPAGGELRFEPGGLHVMLTDLQKPLFPGDSVMLAFTFERAGTVQMRVPVQMSATTP